MRARRPVSRSETKDVPARPVLSAAEVGAFFAALDAARPNPAPELLYTNPYTLLVAVVLSAQASDKSVNAAAAPLFVRVSTPSEMLALGEGALRQAIRSIGLFQTKARHIIALSAMLIERFDGRVPSCREALESLPGVGRKTANVVLNIAFGQPTFPVDTHVFRVCNRTGLAPGKTPLEVEKALERATPAAYAHQAHHHLILHGRYVCKARAPACSACPVVSICAFPRQSG